MAIAPIPNFNRVAGTVLAKAIGPVPAGEIWRVQVRACAVGSANSIVDLRVRKTDGTNAAYRHKGKPVLLNADPYDLEVDFILTAGHELWDRSGNADVDMTYSGTIAKVAG